MTDTPQQTKAQCTSCIENDSLRVWRWEFAPGEHTERHVHELDYLVVPLTDGVYDVTGPGGDSTIEMKAGEPYFRQAGVEHDVANAGPGKVAFVEIELKAAVR